MNNLESHIGKMVYVNSKEGDYFSDFMGIIIDVQNGRLLIRDNDYYVWEVDVKQAELWGVY